MAPALSPAAFAALSLRDQAAHLRALLAAGDASRAAELAAAGEPSSSILDLHAEALLALDRPAEALARVEQRETRARSSVSLGLRARALARLGRVAEAREAVEASGGAQTYLGRCILGEALLDAGEAQEAHALLEQAVGEHPHRRRGLVALVEACGALADWVTGSAYAGRLLDAQDAEEGPLSVRHLERLLRFYQGAGETLRVAQVQEALGQAREAAGARLTHASPTPAAPPAERARPGDPSGTDPVHALPSDAEPVPSEAREHVIALLERHLGFPTPRPGQVEVMARVLRGEDVLAVMPTGGGKSVCYQLPAMLSRGVTLVVSPLIALMKDQLDGLPPAMRAASVALHSDLHPAHAKRILEEVAEGRYRLLYVAPERLRNPVLLAALRRAGVARLVVDEAHCVSVWGHDFRPDYLHIADARRALGQPPLLAMTATAPPRVARDILRRLGDLRLVRVSVARPNLRLEAVVARDADEKLAHLLALCKQTAGPGIVYASSRAKCEQLAAALMRQGIRAEAYHAGLPDRAERQERFMRDETDVLVATVAFGMGVDKGNIRFIFHHDPSTSLENYSQEAGRAGRDGAPARCVLLATAADGGQLKQRARQDLPDRGLVERVRTLVAQAADETGTALVDPAALAALDEDDVKPRVALSILQEAGALARIADVPRFLRVRAGGPEAIRDREVGIFEAAQTLGVAPEDVEPLLLEREARGELFFQVSPRAHLLRATGRLEDVPGVLARYAALAEQRGKEVMDYARATGCRHAYLHRYFGEDHHAARCGHCDACLGIGHEPAAADELDDEEARRHVLHALAGLRGLGQLNLVYHLRGDARAADWLQRRPGAGALAFRSESRVRRLVQEMLETGHLEQDTLPHGGVTLRLSPKGAAALAGDAPLAPPAPPARAALKPAATDKGEPPSKETAKENDEEEPLTDEETRVFLALKAWRRETADAEGVPPYVVAHDRTLRAIARAAPTDAQDLLAVKGMGPKRVEKHGDAILAVVRNPKAA